MTVRSQTHHAVTGAIIPSAGIEANFSELYDLQDGGIDSTNMDMTSNYPWTGTHTFISTATSTSVIAITANSLTSASGLSIVSNSSSTTARKIGSIVQDHASAVNATGLYVQQDSTAPALHLRGASLSLDISSTSTSILVGEKFILEDTTAGIGLYSNNNTTTAGYISLASMTGGAVQNKWGLYRNSNTGGNDFKISFGTNADCTTNTTKFNITDTGFGSYLSSQGLTIGSSTTTSFEGYNCGLKVLSTDSNRRVAEFISKDNSASALAFYILKDSASPASGDGILSFGFFGRNDTASIHAYGAITCYIEDPTTGSENGQLTLRATSGSSTTGFEFLTASGSTKQVDLIGNVWSYTSTATTQDAFVITANSATTGAALRVYSDSNSGSTRSLVEIINDNIGATATDCLYLQQDADDQVIRIINNGASESIHITQYSSGGSPIYISSFGSDPCILINKIFSTNSNIYGIEINVTNSGIGNAIGIDLTDASLDAIFSAPATATALGGFAGWIPVYDTTSGTIRKLPLYA